MPSPDSAGRSETTQQPAAALLGFFAAPSDDDTFAGLSVEHYRIQRSEGMQQQGS